MKIMSINFPGFPHTMGFVAFSDAMGYWCENLCISHMMRFAIFFPVKAILSQIQQSRLSFITARDYCYALPRNNVRFGYVSDLSVNWKCMWSHK